MIVLAPPPFVRALAERLPQFPHSVLLALAANLFLRGLFAPEEARCAIGRIVRLEVRDAGIRCTLRVAPRGYLPQPDGARPDVTVAANLHDFALLALRRADPDALFFERRLAIEGDTELGLVVKNALDRIAPPLPGWLLEPLAELLSPAAEHER
jgi:predicted lipid carrier protein YhbT